MCHDVDCIPRCKHLRLVVRKIPDALFTYIKSMWDDLQSRLVSSSREEAFERHQAFPN
jgi:hypothetical protein